MFDDSFLLMNRTRKDKKAFLFADFYLFRVCFFSREFGSFQKYWVFSSLKSVRSYLEAMYCFL
jgi:hypothetical protein